MIAALLDLALLPVWVTVAAMVAIIGIVYWLTGGGKHK